MFGYFERVLEVALKQIDILIEKYLNHLGGW